MMLASPNIGDRIRLISMDDPDPIEPGQAGTIDRVYLQGSGKDGWHQIDVQWDNGRTLMLSSPLDRFENITQ